MAVSRTERVALECSHPVSEYPRLEACGETKIITAGERLEKSETGFPEK
jgi:hypothetical protein